MRKAAKQPIIIAHRGASGYLPEHTLAAYRLAIDLGADYIEPDLNFTKDGRLVARHDHYLSVSTDVAERPEFENRKKTIESHEGIDWFTEDFTLAEIKTLKARQAFPGRSTAADGLFDILTYEEIIAFAQSESQRVGREIGIYPETKVPGHFANLGYDYADAIIKPLEKAGMNKASSKVYIQSFETPVLKTIRERTDLPLIYLMEEDDGLDMAAVAQFCDGLGPYKKLLATEDLKSTGYIEKAHGQGLEVHPWTFRADQLPPQFSTAQNEFDFYFDLGVDAVFTDFTDVAKATIGARIARHSG